jgi:hypothetical protein
MLLAALVDEKYIQLGFAGFCFLLIGVIVWMIKNHNRINSENSKALIGVIKGNNEALSGVVGALDAVKESDDQVKYSIKEMDEHSKDASKELSGKVDSLRELIMARPCMKGGQHVS